MEKKQKAPPAIILRPEHQEAIVGSGLVDDLIDYAGLAPQPYRYAEGEFLCRFGDVAECLWIIVTGSVAVREKDRTLFIRRRPEVVGEQNLLGNGYRHLFDIVANESIIEVLAIDKESIERHPERDLIYRNIARIVSLKLRDAGAKLDSLSRQLEDDTRILHAYTNQYALSRRMQSGGGRQTDYKVDRAIIWFSDVVDFSRHTLNLSPERAAEIVQRFFNEQSLPIAERHGHIDKFIGDGIMAFWVLRDGHDAGEDCVNALRAAEEARQRVSEIRIGKTALRLRVGLHIGLVLSGDFGSATRHQFTLIGPEVNKAARLEEVHEEDIVEGVAEVGDIRISEDFWAELSDPVRERYQRHSVAQAKNIGKIGLYSSSA